MHAKKIESIGLTKVYQSTIALDNFTHSFEGGRVHALIGKNGSGKSTLMKIISGAIRPTSGIIRIDGKDVSFDSPRDAFSKGIAMVYQELSLIPELSVAENIFLGRLPRSGRRLDWKQAYAQAQELLDSMNLCLSAKTQVKALSVGQQQVVEIVKAMSFSPSVLILDEPTSALARHETESLFGLVKQLKDRGVAILYITHRLQELYEIADTVTVLRDGCLVGSVEIEQSSPERIVDMMFGKVEQKKRPEDISVSEETVLEVRDLCRERTFSHVSFTLKKGEILGLAGMLGSGRSEILRSVFGADSFDSGTMSVNGVEISRFNPALMKRVGIAMTPENRKEEGLVQILSVRENMCMAGMERIAPRGFTNRKRERLFIKNQIDALEIKVSDPECPVSSLSGGNQQKVVIGNWLNNKPKVIFFDEPTRGIDVQAKQQVFQIIWNLSRHGISSIFVSTELEELLEVCHRILIVHHGEILKEVFPEAIDLKELYGMCMDESLCKEEGNV